MVQASEIRIGNLLRYPNGKIFKVELSDFLSNDFWEDVADNIKPIPLTPELLEKCGFEINGFYEFDFKLSEYSRLVLDLRQGYLWLRESDISRRPENDSIVCLWNRDFIKTIHVHQLQNLYFALTGTELTVNLGTPVEAS